ncbi:uncharacterized protein NP_5214A [Natronomonas pharaonis DSM 2160]|uniref:Uncharacterized protein n=1 Tax=Natronomonas pharaonis (strain ATCC 35678 / DSM 2160 / CIP 103997 / JCM 8858 / NBRC 14720 / NCIMB 2260 / Gabara) TaxID=348780 RepID=A0A1U7EZF3_NATPD|nr:hypothetical protein [Natronomonas pharaonis]CAI50698.1 uncharacterized protein NP_5214A [Natronomonas pharaonis DSM 2160]
MNDRGRVPFALIGVLLLVTSGTLAVSVSTHDAGTDTSTDRAVGGAAAAATTELRGAADAAATAAAAEPTTTPANTTAGRALDSEQPFRDSLRLRVYLRALDRVDGTTFERDGTVVSASLPDVEPTREGYREAIQRVEVERAGKEDTALAVELTGLSLTVSRENQTVAETERSPSVVVANPALSLHDRTERFERRANAPVTRSGLSQRLTARLYPIAWSRGYAQYGGAPIATVLGTRHIELATNDALLAEQRTAFGAADPAGDRGVAAAGRRVATTDLLAGVGGDEEWTDMVLEAADELGPDPPDKQPVGTWREEPEADDVTVDVGASADTAFADLVGSTGTDELARVIERAHTVEARVVAETDRTDRRADTDGSPGSDWELVADRSHESVSVESAGGQPPAADDWATRDGAAFDATVVERVTRTWSDGNETTTTGGVIEREYHVRVAAQARTKPIAGVPFGPLERFEAATERAVSQAVARGDGLDGAAATAASSDRLQATAAATAPRSVSRSDVEMAVEATHETARNRSVTAAAPAVGTGRVNPPDRLRTALEADREQFIVDADPKPAVRTKRAAQLAYLDGVDASLSERETAHDGAADGIDDTVGEHIDPSRLDGALAAHRQAAKPPTESYADPAGTVSFEVETAPSYLTTSAVERDRIDARGGGSVYPLATRNVNLFPSLHDPVADSLFDRIPFFGTERTSLSRAASTLAAADPDEHGYDRLASAVAASSRYVRGDVAAALIDAGVAPDEAMAALEADGGTAEEALRLANGTAVDQAVEAVEGNVDDSRLETEATAALSAALKRDDARPPAEPVDELHERTREQYADELEGTLADGLEAGEERARERLLGESMGAMPAGFPLAPIPGYWYATVNVWYVDIAGTYERFAVRSNRGGPQAATTYLRDGRTATVAHDGKTAVLGSGERVSFRTETAVVVVVPPGPRGVGDTDGTIDERAAGWPP